MLSEPAIQRRFMLETVGHDNNYPEMLLPQFDILLEVYEKPSEMHGTIPDVWLRYYPVDEYGRYMSQQQAWNSGYQP